MLTPSMESLRDIFYRCQFHRLLRLIDAAEFAAFQPGSRFELMMLKANALFELHEAKRAREVLTDVSKESGNPYDEHYLYVLARLSYFDDDYETARQSLLKVLEHTIDRTHQFKALIGLANTLYSLEQYEHIPDFIKRMQSLEPLDNEDERITLLIFLGNYHRATGSFETARLYFHKAMATSAKRGWTYFIHRSLLGLAETAASQGKTSDLKLISEMLRSFVDESESRYMTYIVNKRFNDNFSIATAIDFDPSNLRILVEDQWVSLQDRPLVFKFLHALHDHGDFMAADSLSQALWPRESFSPKIHSAKIAEVAAQARGVIEKYEKQPKILLAGRDGYKLASQ